MDLAPGTILLGKYRVEELIGTGGMSQVMRVSHLYLQQSVALKILLPTMAANASTRERFLREAQATVKLRSEHIARVSDVGTLPDGTPFMEMEFLDGNDLNQILRHHGPQVPAIVCDLMLQACEGLSEAHHAGIVHRDVKPSNFFITRRPDGSMLLKILDFGISKTPVGYDGELTGSQAVIGTPTYMAPEQMKSGRSADPRSDIWSLGVVMYQLINGRPPFAGESYAELVLKVGAERPEPMHVQLPQGLHDVIFRCLEKDPNRRHQSVAELARLLAPYATDPGAGAQSASRSARILMGSRIHNQAMALTSNGGLTAPISPAQLAPRSWQSASSPSNLSQARGQMTYQVGGAPLPKRGLWIAGVAGLCLGTGVGGFFISRHLGDDAKTAAKAPDPAPHATPDKPAVTKDPTPVVATKPVDPAPTPPPPVAPTVPTVAPTVPTVAPTVPTIAAAKPDPKPTIPTVTTTKPTVAPKPAVVAPKPVAKPVTTAVAAAKPVAKPATPPATKPATPPAKPATKPKHPTDDDLFNSRH